MIEKVIDCSGYSMSLQVRRRSADDGAMVSHRAGHKAVISGVAADAHDKVEALVNDINHPVCKACVNLNLGPKPLVLAQ